MKLIKNNGPDTVEIIFNGAHYLPTTQTLEVGKEAAVPDDAVVMTSTIDGNASVEISAIK